MDSGLVFQEVTSCVAEVLLVLARVPFSHNFVARLLLKHLVLITERMVGAKAAQMVDIIQLIENIPAGL